MEKFKELFEAKRPKIFKQPEEAAKLILKNRELKKLGLDRITRTGLKNGKLTAVNLIFMVKKTSSIPGVASGNNEGLRMDIEKILEKIVGTPLELCEYCDGTTTQEAGKYVKGGKWVKDTKYDYEVHLTFEVPGYYKI